jgi:TP901 family phage tail tape measure protein
VETENALESLTAEYKNFGTVSAQQLAQVGNKMQDIGNKMSSVGSTLTKSVTAPIMGIASASAVAWKEVDEAMDTVAVKTGATGDQLEATQDIVSSLATEIPADFQAVGDAVGEVNTRFGVTGEELKDLSAQFLKFAEVNGTDVTSSIDSMQAAMQAFGVETKDAGKFLDMINKAGQDTGVSVDKLADLMKTNSEALKSMGMNASDSAMFLANLDKNGVDASTAIAGLKTALKNGNFVQYAF